MVSRRYYKGQLLFSVSCYTKLCDNVFISGQKTAFFYDLTILFLSNLKFSSQLKSSLNSLRSFLWFLLGKSSCQSTIKTLGQSSKVYFHGIFVDVRRIFAQIVSLIVFSLYIQITKIWFIAFSMAFNRFYYFMIEIILILSWAIWEIILYRSSWFSHVTFMTGM